MTTREALAAMTDRGDFESLATAILRSIEPDCTAVIHHGINAQGEPVKAPVDAWCQVPASSPPRFVLIQHTTTGRDNLRGKWLGNKGGDLPKTAAERAKIIAQFPAAKFRLFLTTNLVPEATLQRDVYAAAAEAGLEAIIVDQTRMADHLDSPAGQYLRRSILKIEAEELSKELLGDLSRKSALLHSQRFLSGEATVRIERETDRQIRSALHDPTISLHCLVADPGFGKSTSAQYILSEHITAGGYGLWIPESILAVSTSLDDAINRTLCALHPALSPETASAWRASCDGQRLLLVVDDINHAPDRETLLQKLQGWASPVESASGSASTRPPAVVLCPIWTHFWETARDPNKQRNWLNMTSFGPMESAEAAAAIEEVAKSCGRSLTPEETRECAQDLNNDPYLMGIFGVLLREAASATAPQQLTRDVMKQYLASVLRNTVSRSGGEFTITDLRDALAAITSQMLLQKDLRPRWSKMRTWLKDSFQAPVPAAAEFLRRDAVICRLVDADALVFRHDRLMQHLLAESMWSLLGVPHVTDEVFYAELLGQTLATAAVSDGQLAMVAEKNPLALFEAIRAIGLPSTQTHRSIIDAAIGWVRRPEMPNEVPEALRFAVGLSLMETDSPVVLEIARFLPPDYGVLAASMRNGSAWAGACLLGESGRSSFEPGVRHTWRDPALAHALRNHRQKFITELRAMLPRTDITYEQSLGAILLSGYLAEPELAAGVVSCCKDARNPDHLLAEAVWAVGRCCGEQAADYLRTLFTLLKNVSAEKGERDWSRRDGIARNFSDFPPDTFHPTAVAYIIRVADEEPELRDVLFPLIHTLNVPDALEHLARHKAERAKARGKDEVTGLDFMFSRWDRNSRQSFVRPSADSRSRLRALWQSDNEDRVVRSAAFKIWSWSADTGDFAHLRSVSAESPLFHTALWRRAELGDRDCIPELTRCLRDDAWLANVAHHVWSAELSLVVDDWLTRLESGTVENPGYVSSCFGPLLTHIPLADGERLLKAHWQGLRGYYDFVQAALLVCRPATLELADEAIRAKTVNDPSPTSQ